MTQLFVEENLVGIKPTYAKGFDLALALREKYSDEIIAQRFHELDFRELEDSEVTPEIEEAYQKALQTPSHHYTNI